MLPTLKRWGEYLFWDVSVCACVRACVRAFMYVCMYLYFTTKETQHLLFVSHLGLNEIAFQFFISVHKVYL